MSTATQAWFIVASALTTIAMLAAAWVGLVGMARGRRGLVWWLMTIGVVFLTLGKLLSAWGSYLTSRFSSSILGFGTGSADSSADLISGIGSGMTVLGIFVFGIGFAIHGLRVARTRARLAELEQVTRAMAEELDRTRQGGPAA